MKQQRSTLEKRNPLEERKSGDAVVDRVGDRRC